MYNTVLARPDEEPLQGRSVTWHRPNADRFALQLQSLFAKVLVLLSVVPWDAVCFCRHEERMLFFCCSCPQQTCAQQTCMQQSLQTLCVSAGVKTGQVLAPLPRAQAQVTRLAGSTCWKMVHMMPQWVLAGVSGSLWTMTSCTMAQLATLVSYYCSCHWHQCWKMWNRMFQNACIILTICMEGWQAYKEAPRHWLSVLQLSWQHLYAVITLSSMADNPLSTSVYL